MQICTPRIYLVVHATRKSGTRSNGLLDREYALAILIPDFSGCFVDVVPNRVDVFTHILSLGPVSGRKNRLGYLRHGIAGFTNHRGLLSRTRRTSILVRHVSSGKDE